MTSRRRQPAHYKYKQIAADLRQKIISGELKPGDRLPSQEQLAGSYNTSVVTLRGALSKLKLELLVDSQQGIGWFICTPRQVAASWQRSQSAEHKQAFQEAPPWVAELLRRPVDEVALDRFKVYAENNRPVEVETAYVPVDPESTPRNHP